MGGLKLTGTLLVLTLMAATSSALTISAASGGSGTWALVINWGQVAVEYLLEWAKKVLFRTKVTEPQFNQNLPNPCVGQGNSNSPQCGVYLSKVSNECAGKIGYSFGKAGFGNFGINCNITKLLVLTGEPPNSARKIEVIDLENPSNSCSLKDFPDKLAYAVGGFTKNGPVLCGGFNYDTRSRPKSCFTIGPNGAEKTGEMLTKRNSASAVVLPNGELWINGGYDENGRLSTSETFSKPSSQNGIDLEKATHGHCSMMINATTAFITGGITGSDPKETYLFDVRSWKRTKGPVLIKARYYHGCGVFKHDGRAYAVVAGGRYYTSTTEFFDIKAGIGWTSGPKLPVKMEDFSMVSTAQGLMAVGGYDFTHRRRKDEILQLKCEAGKDISECKWEEYQPKKLDVARYRHVVIPLPSSYEICNN